MAELVKTMKLHIHVSENDAGLLCELTERYAKACTEISKYVFDHNFPLNFMELQDAMYSDIREKFHLKSQMTISSFKTVTARYKTIKDQMEKNPYKYQDEKGNWKYIPRTLEWLQHPVVFSRPQADLVRGRDYSFVDNGHSLSLNTLGKRIRVTFDVPEYFEKYFDGTWKFGTGKVVSLLGEWYFHIPMSKTIEHPDTDSIRHVVGIDRGLRFLATSYDEKGNTLFFKGKQVLAKRDTYNKVRAGLQAKGTKSAKRVLKRISERENRWMTDVNHQITKTLVNRYGQDTLFVLEDLTNVSFDEQNLSSRTKKQRNQLRSWAFYQMEQFLTYKAAAAGSMVMEVPAEYTSQRCPKCGRIMKTNRRHDIHEYICDRCGYRSNDDRSASMNIQMLGTMYISGDENPRFGVRKKTK